LHIYLPSPLTFQMYISIWYNMIIICIIIIIIIIIIEEKEQPATIIFSSIILYIATRFSFYQRPLSGT
jgi:hypothetical protein